MGSGSYFADVRTARMAVTSAPRDTSRAFDYSARGASGGVTSVHPDLNIFGKVRECLDTPEHPRTTPIVIAMDVTKSRGDDTKAIYAEVPKLLGVLKSEGIITDPQILSAAIGDAFCDKAPLQVGQFESDRRIDDQLSRIWMEEGGGGTGRESYELLAYVLVHRTIIDCTKRGERGFVFFTGDEAPYPTVVAEQIKRCIGPMPGSRSKKTEEQDVPTDEVFRALQKKFNPFLIFPRLTMEQRVKSIDEEIRRRLIDAGGQYREVSIRCSLIWENRNDLDLHCITPAKEHIYYGQKRAGCGGELDVDRNVHGETTKPVENIRWAKGVARAGRYEFYVENYRFHEKSQEAIPFKVELDVDGVIQTFHGEIPAGATHEKSQVVAFEFDYDPSNAKGNAEAHAAYADDVVLKQWSRYLPATQILRITDPKSAVEVMLGVLALTKGGQTLDQFEAAMKLRKVAQDRRTDVISALTEFAARGALTEVGAEVFE